MIERTSSGIPALDAVLGGGLPSNAINVLMGPPGSGKTILAQQFVFHNATVDRPGLYLATATEPLEKVLRYGEGMDHFDTAAVGRRVFFEDLGAALNDSGGLGAVLERTIELVRARRPGVVAIDSFKALRTYALDATAYRRFLHQLAGRLSAFPATSIWIGEYDRSEVVTAPELAIADAIVELSTQRANERESRVLQVLKLRGSGFLSGSHAYRLSRSGLAVFPRLADVAHPSDDVAVERISSGIPPLDDALDDGYLRGASTLIAGPSGSGKTVMGLHFVFNGARSGEPGVIATFQENPAQLERMAAGFGWSLGLDGVNVMHRSPVDLYLDEWVHELIATIERLELRRVLIDSLGDLRMAAPDELRFREYVYSFLQRMAREGVSTMMTQEVSELFGITRLSEYGVSNVSDNVVLLQFLRGRSRIRRAMTIMKTRASGHDTRIREFEITPQGFVVGSEFEPEQSLE
jgi:circadian clock protein KaiC